MNLKNESRALFISLIVVVAVPLFLFMWWTGSDFVADPPALTTPEENLPAQLLPDLKTDTSKTSIPINQILSGGTGKDGIPALTNPKFTSVSQAELSDDVQGILIEIENQKRYYPYNILVWHEIVNDQIGDTPFMVTFCPLCGSAIAFDRRVDGTTYEFGVSGLLFESNLLMYDRATETLWSQAKGEAVVGDLVGKKLTYLPFQLLTFENVKKNHPGARVLSSDTGHLRNYQTNPYGNYDEAEELLFPVSVQDERFKAKELMYVVPLDGKSAAFPVLQLKEGETTLEKDGVELIATKENGEVFISDLSGKRLPGYYEMWFSWVTHHQENGIIFQL